MVKRTNEMADCECLMSCPFICDRMEGKPATSEMYRNAYCHCDNTGCARYIVLSTLGRDAVPPDLFPNQVDRALEIIDRAGDKPGRKIHSKR